MNVFKVLKIYEHKLDPHGRTYEGNQIEGLACFSAFGKIFLVYGERGGRVEGGNKVGTIFWGIMDFSNDQFERLGEAPLVRQPVLENRDCSSLFLSRCHDDSIAVLSVAAADKGDNGSFDSVLYVAGTFVLNSKTESVQYIQGANSRILTRCCGIKVEALAGPAKNVEHSQYSIGSDDENFGGVWRSISIE
jgi:hypothetical protein